MTTTRVNDFVRAKAEVALGLHGSEIRIKPLAILEKTVLSLAMYPSGAIAQRLAIPTSSVERTLRRIQEKLGSFSRTGALLRAIVAGEIDTIPFLVSEVVSERILTPRQAQLLSLAAQGLGNKQIAEATSTELSTVKNHLHSAFMKLGVTNRTQAVLVWLWMGREPMNKVA